jgi:hypothetical protein
LKKTSPPVPVAGPSGPDTSREAAEVQARIQERLGGSGRLRLAYEMSVAARGLTLAGLRARRPDASPEELARMLRPGPR